MWWRSFSTSWKWIRFNRLGRMDKNVFLAKHVEKGISDRSIHETNKLYAESENFYYRKWYPKLQLRKKTLQNFSKKWIISIIWFQQKRLDICITCGVQISVKICEKSAILFPWLQNGNGKISIIKLQIGYLSQLVTTI